MSFKSPLIKLFSFLTLVFLLTGCEPEKPGLYNNDHIKSSQRNDFHDLNNQLFAGLRANNAKLLSNIMAKEFIEDNSKNRTVELLYNRIKEDSSYDVLDEYYIINDQRGNHTIEGETKSINNYRFDYSADTREMYIVFFAPKKEPNRYLFTAVYNKLDYGWKLTRLDVGKYTINGKTAPELYKLAKDEVAKNQLVDGLNTAEQAYECTRPSGGWKYPDEESINKFYTEVMEKVNKKYNFPFTLSKVNTKPQIFRVFNQNSPQGVFPMIYYLTDIKLSNVEALKKENINIQKVIGQAMPGIDKNNKYIYYSVFNQMPDGTKAFDHYDITEKVR